MNTWWLAPFTILIIGMELGTLTVVQGTEARVIIVMTLVPGTSLLLIHSVARRVDAMPVVRNISGCNKIYKVIQISAHWLIIIFPCFRLVDGPMLI